MGKDNSQRGNSRRDPKRQRLDDPVQQQQRTTFEEDMARIRDAMMSGGGNDAAPSTNVSPPGNGGTGMGDRGARPDVIPAPRDYSPHKKHYQQQGGESTMQQQQASGESTLQHPQHPSCHSQQRRAPLPHAPRTTGGNGEQSKGGGLDNDYDEEGCGGNWLQNFTPRSATRVGENYQVTNLPAAPSRAVLAAPRSYVSPGVSGQ
mmetsp:Transcript_50462/g.107469  ORF Transcript_50462/g.107469 Transcript_50462/m.107469 type:complete len:204 (+) Transcript_50462:22-633(+)